MRITEELRKMVALSFVPELGPVKFKKLAANFNGPSDIFESIVIPAGEGCLLEEADRQIEMAGREGAEIVGFFDPRYPMELKEIFGPPILLYVMGKLPPPETVKIAIVGSRDASFYGLRMSRLISRDLARVGLVVVSGMARGIDSAAHEGALDADGVTLAALGGGLLSVPHAQRKFADQIAKKGALITEYPMETVPRPGYFPVRNRIISGLAKAVLVVEAREKSGAMITVAAALEQGRDVYAVPGNVDSARSAGTNFLLKQGAKLITSADDILVEFNIKKNSVDFHGNETTVGKRPDLSDEQNAVLSLFESEPVHVDALIERSSLSTPSVISALSVLEIKGFVGQMPGKNFVRRN